MGSSCVKCCDSESTDNFKCYDNESIGIDLHSSKASELDAVDVNDIQCDLKPRDYDICGLIDNKFIIQAGVGYAEMKSLSQEMHSSDVLPMRQECMHGDHYLAKCRIVPYSTSPELSIVNEFYVIKGKSCMQVLSLKSSYVETIFDLHPECQGGRFYLAKGDNFYIIRPNNTYLQVRSMSLEGYRSETSSCHKLHESFTNGLYYYATDHYFYTVKEHAEFGLVYHRTKDLRSKEEEEAVCPVHPSIAKFLQGSSLDDHQTVEGIFHLYNNNIIISPILDIPSWLLTSLRCKTIITIPSEFDHCGPYEFYILFTAKNKLITVGLLSQLHL